MSFPNHMQPPICLRYIMWALAASTSDKYWSLHELFYLRAREYIKADEMERNGKSMATVAHVQALILLTVYEFKMSILTRAWMSCGSASRLAIMLGLNQMDSPQRRMEPLFCPPHDRIELEERRRTFWAAFDIDRIASITTGWPASIDEQDVRRKMSLILTTINQIRLICHRSQPSFRYQKMLS